jgi:DedD protein
MTDNISEEELLLRKRARRRLVGAIALVIAAIIILPLIFDEEPEVSQQEIAIRLPSEAPMSEPAPSLQTYEEFVDDVTEEEIDEMNAHEQAEPLPFESAAPSQMEAYPVEKLEKQNAIPVPTAKPQQNFAAVDANPTRTDRAQTSSTKTFVVQLGAFSDHSKAMQQQQNLVSRGINAYTETLMTNNKEMMRVRVGPFTTRSAAEQELIKLRKLGLDGVVTAK